MRTVRGLARIPLLSFGFRPIFLDTERARNCRGRARHGDSDVRTARRSCASASERIASPRKLAISVSSRRWKRPVPRSQENLAKAPSKGWHAGPSTPRSAAFFASMGIATGDALPVIGALLGHADVKTTARYAHLADDPVKAAADRIAGAMADALKGHRFEGQVVAMRRR
jgi:integrase